MEQLVFIVSLISGDHQETGLRGGSAKKGGLTLNPGSTVPRGGEGEGKQENPSSNPLNLWFKNKDENCHSVPCLQSVARPARAPAVVDTLAFMDCNFEL